MKPAPTRHRALALLASSPATIAEIATALGTSLQAARTVLEDARRLGLAAREPHIHGQVIVWRYGLLGGRP